MAVQARLLQTAMICFAVSWSVDSEIRLERPVMLIRGELRAVIRRLWLQSPG